MQSLGNLDNEYTILRLTKEILLKIIILQDMNKHKLIIILKLQEKKMIMVIISLTLIPIY